MGVGQAGAAMGELGRRGLEAAGRTSSHLACARRPDFEERADEALFPGSSISTQDTRKDHHTKEVARK